MPDSQRARRCLRAMRDLIVSFKANPGFDVASWQGLFLPAGTPSAIVNKRNNEVRRIFALPDVRERIAVTGADIATTTPEAFVDYIRAEIVELGKGG